MNKAELTAGRRRRRRTFGRRVRAACVVLGAGATCAALVAAQDGATSPSSKPTLDETRLTMTKWIETQQIIARERNDWQQARELLKGRVDLVAREASTLDERIAQAQASVVESNRTRDALVAENDQLKAAADQLLAAVAAMEGEVRRLVKMTPDPIRARLQPLLQRMPEEGAVTRVSVAERFQNVLGILNELNKANSEISVEYEVRTLADGTSAEVQSIYVGLAQAYFISPRGEAGIGRPGPDGWTWSPAPGIADQVLTALEILQGKQTPAFVPLPVRIQ